MLTGAELYQRGMATLLASWQACARGSRGASVARSPGLAAAIFPAGPEKAYYNNALLERGLAPAGRAAALDTMEAGYAAAFVARYAAWVHESDEAMRADLEARGYTLDATTRAMGMELGGIRLPRPVLELGPADWRECLRIVGVPPGLLSGVDHEAFRVLVARLGSASVAAAMACDHDGDCGIYNVSTVAFARRRGLGTALTARLAHDAAARGCRTASLQSTPMAERIYAAVGFRDLGQILEYVPSAAA